MKTVLITGAAGFIGYHLSSLLSAGGYNVIGIDSLNAYYDVQLKNDRLSQLKSYNNFTFYNIDISDKVNFDQLFKSNEINIVIIGKWSFFFLLLDSCELSPPRHHTKPSCIITTG